MDEDRVMDIVAARNPAWADAEHTGIRCEVHFERFDNFMPFIAMPDDPHEHGRDIFEACLAGDFGDIADFVPGDGE
ncbi:hypothetical protein OKW40_001967 [Paraburkholderia sp. RAU6.4a]|uniref:hypothetical protein n=1 Tax=unclassified Paraburkholderia TaxID=2615204 RepID=UPI001619CA33|nr:MULTISPECIES: hypothetical protein [unclassified Paraburkholderia]MBB5413894.1 hypothetical protein [Paraburkholderia sp. HC6.4b]MBB5456317.1 hypothetical protein [Paraburkholderia sp. Kb1A]